MGAPAGSCFYVRAGLSKRLAYDADVHSVAGAMQVRTNRETRTALSWNSAAHYALDW